MDRTLTSLNISVVPIFRGWRYVVIRTHHPQGAETVIALGTEPTERDAWYAAYGVATLRLRVIRGAR